MSSTKFFKWSRNERLPKNYSNWMKAIGFHSSMRIVVWVLGIGMFTVFPNANAAEPTNPLNRDFTITIDPTTLNPPTWWHVPGVTPLIWTMDPVMTQAYRTTQVRTITLKPGEYRFGTFTFDFAFTVTLGGVLDFSPKLAQCVKGQGTNTLAVLCSHTQPYKQEPDY